jgi:hypothetical protein
MVTNQSHEMRLETVHPSGAEEWMCPECGRRFVAQWEPKFRRVILQQGQDGVAHKGQAMNVLAEDQEQPNDDSELQDVWKELLNKLDFNSEDDPDSN